MRTPKSVRRSAFTLVELLVVIGVIALLIAILLPVLNKARDLAMRTKCLSQIRQIGAGMVMYANDHRGFFPPEGRGNNRAWQPPYLFKPAYEYIVTNALGGHGWIADDSGAPGNSWLYCGDPRPTIWNCPGWEFWSPYRYFTGTGTWPKLYDIGYYYLGGRPENATGNWELDPTRRPHKLSTSEGSRKAILADIVMHVQPNQQKPMAWIIPHPKPGNSYGPFGSAEYAPAGGNQFFADGHGEWVTTYPQTPNALGTLGVAPNNVSATHTNSGFLYYWW
jgi:prepilin-type N-terminal cleavage/methylation domain-containing protein